MWCLLAHAYRVSGGSGSKDGNVQFSSNRGANVVGSGNSSVIPISDQHTHHDHAHDHHSDHDHSGSPHHSSESSADDDHHHDHSHGHSHGHGLAEHVHEDRVTVECRAVDIEGEDGPGKIVGAALVRLLCKKGITSPGEIWDTIGLLERAGERLSGADIVLKAWTDGAFKAQLLADGELISV